MAAKLLKENLYWIGVENPELRVFDIIMETKKGTTYNSYLLVGEDKVAVVDNVKNPFYPEFRENIISVIGDRKVDYIVTLHTECDHSGTIGSLLDDYPEAQVVSSRAAMNYLKDILNRDFSWIDARDRSVLSLGSDLNLEFISAPNLHWPDTIFAYAREMKTMFTCDFLGCHYAEEEAQSADDAESYLEEMKYYFDVIMGPFKGFVNKALDRLNEYDFDMVCVSHGPVHTEDIGFYLEKYREWAKLPDSYHKDIEILYVSAYGNTADVANHIADRLRAKGETVHVNDITEIGIPEASRRLEESKAFLIGSPTINRDAVLPAWELLGHASAITNKGKVCGAFGSYGWTGEGVQLLTERLKGLKMSPVEGFRFKFVASEEEYRLSDEFADRFLDAVSEKCR
ncbi:FprA family A-type flavoprotein [Youngiibacter fragilis]|uniref:Lactamase n=1 Tax=Youngiibacter fragilis 232.1 TaxID=994573 RepID=V7I3I4_9CLOT|nr:FprA family A-type flavoprotein [Youngiibacter fragilis]ETA79846.1 lactamase [Youngiibacter fragilis 232.1]